MELAVGHPDGTATPGIRCDLTAVNKAMLLPLPRMPRVLPHVEWFSLALQKAKLGGRIRILDENPNPLTRYKRYGRQFSAGRLNTHHYASQKFNQGEERRIRRETLQRCFEANWVSFQINVETLPPLEAFPYLGRTIAYNNSDLAAVYLNLRKARGRWGMVSIVLERTSATVRDQGTMYKVVAQSVILYSSDIQVVNGQWSRSWRGSIIRRCDGSRG